MKRAITIREKKLEKGEYGTADLRRRVIELNRAQGEFQRMDTLIHEWMHIEFPKMSEKQVRRHSTSLSNLLWEQLYRRIH